MKIGIKLVIEALSAAAIVASLIFVGIQLRLEQQIALGAAYQQRADSRMENLRMKFENTEYINDIKVRIERGERFFWWSDEMARMNPDQNIPMEEIIRTSYAAQIDAVSLDNLNFQAELGLLDEAYLESAASAMSIGMSVSLIMKTAFISSPVSPATHKLILEMASADNAEITIAK